MQLLGRPMAITSRCAVDGKDNPPALTCTNTAITHGREYGKRSPQHRVLQPLFPVTGLKLLLACIGIKQTVQLRGSISQTQGLKLTPLAAHAQEDVPLATTTTAVRFTG